MPDRGVPSPYVTRVHPYPTRYHGGIWVRPQTSPLPYVVSPQSVFKPDDFAPAYYKRYPFGEVPGVTPMLLAEVAVGLGIVAAGVWYLFKRRA